MMKKYSKAHPPKADELEAWTKNRTVNPRTGRKIKPTGRIYRTLERAWAWTTQQQQPDDQDTCGMLLIPIPVLPHRPVFEFAERWDPFTGERLGPETDLPPLKFDPDGLVHWFYTQRLNKLWEEGGEGYHGLYGDAVGNGPHFNIHGRGAHPGWYLFRVPDVDRYLPPDTNLQLPTTTPHLTDKEVIALDALASQYGDSYYQRFGTPRPKLTLMKAYYDVAVHPNPWVNVASSATAEYRQRLQQTMQHDAVDALRFM